MINQDQQSDTQFEGNVIVEIGSATHSIGWNPALIVAEKSVAVLAQYRSQTSRLSC